MAVTIVTLAFQEVPNVLLLLVIKVPVEHLKCAYYDFFFFFKGCTRDIWKFPG